MGSCEVRGRCLTRCKLSQPRLPSKDIHASCPLPHSHHTKRQSQSMDSSSVLSDEDYDVISNPSQRSLESSIAWDVTIASGHGIASPTSPGPSGSPSSIPGGGAGHALPREIPPTDAARVALSTVSLAPADIQTYVRNAMEGSAAAGASASAGYPAAERTVRVYVDGAFDVLDAG